MPVVTKDQALELLAGEVENKLGADELLEVYNEIFPDKPYSEEDAHEDTGPLVERLVDHIHSGLEIEEVLDLWGLIFSRHRNVWYDEDEERIHFNEETEAILTE
jgi:hypothetical protein